MKTKIFTIVLLLSLSTVLVAQTAENGPKKAPRGPQGQMQMYMKGRQMGPAQGLNLTDAQKEAFKQGMIALQKQTQQLRNELGEAEAHQKTLMMSEKTDLAAINKNIEKIGALKVEMAKIEVKHRLDMRAQLTDEQKLKFDLFRGKMNQKMGQKGPKGMKRGRMMHQQGAMN